MTNEQIKDQIDANNAMIEELFTPNKFTLNNMVMNLLQENSKLQNQCTHKFENGNCIFCYKQEEVK